MIDVATWGGGHRCAGTPRMCSIDYDQFDGRWKLGFFTQRERKEGDARVYTECHVWLTVTHCPWCGEELPDDGALNVNEIGGIG